MEIYYSKEKLCYFEQSILIGINEIIREVIAENSPGILDLIKELNFTILGHMYSYLERNDPEDDLVLSIAELLLAYDDLDYPLAHRIEMSLYNMTGRSLQWLSTKDESLHNLALIVIKKSFLDRECYESLSRGMRTSLATGLLEVISQNPDFFSKYQRTIMLMLDFDDFRYHPYLDTLKEHNPQLRAAINVDYVEDDDQFFTNVDDSSFYSAEQDSFGEEQDNVAEIIEILDQEASRLPKNIYLHKSIGDEPLDTTIKWSDWEKATYGEARSACKTPQSSNTQTSGLGTQSSNYKESQTSYWSTQPSDM